MAIKAENFSFTLSLQSISGVCAVENSHTLDNLKAQAMKEDKTSVTLSILRGRQKPVIYTLSIFFMNGQFHRSPNKKNKNPNQEAMTVFSSFIAVLNDFSNTEKTTTPHSPECQSLPKKLVTTEVGHLSQPEQAKSLPSSSDTSSICDCPYSDNELEKFFNEGKIIQSSLNQFDFSAFCHVMRQNKEKKLARYFYL